MITDELYNSASFGRIQGFKKSTYRKGIKSARRRYKICDKIHEGYHIQAGYDETIKMLKQKDKFDGIFCYN